MVTMDLPIPAWFKYRQGEAKPAGENCYELTAPVIEPAYIRIRKNDAGWQAEVAGSAEGAALMTSRPDIELERDAWQAAFELYRVIKVI
jgi:hypothetical protein